MNEAAAQICRHIPALLTRRDELFPLARQVVRDSGYQYSKGHSRSTQFGAGKRSYEDGGREGGGGSNSGDGSSDCDNGMKRHRSHTDLNYQASEDERRKRQVSALKPSLIFIDSNSIVLLLFLGTIGICS